MGLEIRLEAKLRSGSKRSLQEMRLEMRLETSLQCESKRSTQKGSRTRVQHTDNAALAQTAQMAGQGR